MADGGISLYLALATAAVSAGTAVYSSEQQKKSAKMAAEFNAEEARKAGKVKADDDRQNALRRQEVYRKHMAGLRAKMFAQSGTIEGGNADFLNETVGDLQLRILDDSVKSQRAQASYANAAFRSDWQAGEAERAGNVNTAAAALNGFASVYSTGVTGGAWGYGGNQPNAQASALN